MSPGSGSGAGVLYCGRILGVRAIPGSDGQCGPNNGPRCADCYFADRPIYQPEVHNHAMRHVSCFPRGYGCDLCECDLTGKSGLQCLTCKRHDIGTFDVCQRCAETKLSQAGRKNGREVDKAEEQRMQKELQNISPQQRAQMLDKLKELMQSTGDMDEADQVAVGALFRVLSMPNLQPNQIMSIVKAAAAKEVKGEVKEEIATEILCEAGLDGIDPTGLLSVVKIARGIANKDPKQVAQGAGGLVVGKLLFGAVGVCTIC